VFKPCYAGVTYAGVSHCQTQELLRVSRLLLVICSARTVYFCRLPNLLFMVHATYTEKKPPHLTHSLCCHRISWGQP
jgi:hypothetical protein